MNPSFDVVVPTLGRPSLGRLLEALAAAEGPWPGQVFVVVDGGDETIDPPPGIARQVTVLSGAGAGPAAARNVGWKASAADWIVFLDDDVVPNPGWSVRLEHDLVGLPPDMAASQGRVRVPLPADRRPTDWERNVKRLESALWITADMAIRRQALETVGGFDERFRRAFREDADLALRLFDAGWSLVQGSRETLHPVGPGQFLKSVRLQAGNADDALMETLHGPNWYERADAPRGRRSRHLGATAALALALLTRRKTAWVLWTALTAEFALRRILPGPRTADEVARMAVTSALIPPAAIWHYARGKVRARRLARPGAVLLDRDGTLVHDVPYNGEPDRVVPLEDARDALARLRAAGLPIAVVSNQSGIGRGLLSTEQVQAVNRRVEELLEPLGPWFVCPHAPDMGCACRKPRPGLVVAAAEALGVEPARCVVIGDVGADVQAALSAGARAILVPNGKTRPEEVASAPLVAPSLSAAVDLVLEAAR